MRYKNYKFILIITCLLTIFLTTIIFWKDKLNPPKNLNSLSKSLVNSKLLFKESNITTICNTNYCHSLISSNVNLRESFYTTKKFSCDISYKTITALHRIGWQQVDSNTLIYSAHYDSRRDSPVIRIIGLSAVTSSKLCQFHYANKSVEHTSAEYYVVPEGHMKRFENVIYTCKLNGEIPDFISLVSNICEKPNNVLALTNNERFKTMPKYNFSVCIAPLNMKFNDKHKLIEIIELNRMFGADQIFLYNYSTGIDVDKVINFYLMEGIVTLLPWNLPVSDPEKDVHYYAQIAMMNDCLYQTLWLSQFLVATDLDEIIVPRNTNNWYSMLQNISQNALGNSLSNQQLLPGAYMFRSSFFRTEWPENAKFNTDILTYNVTNPIDKRFKFIKRSSIRELVNKFNIISLKTLTREQNIFPLYQRTKCIIWPSSAFSIGIHFVHSFIDDIKLRHTFVEPNVALVHHYRIWVHDTNDRYIDLRILDFINEIIFRIKYRHEVINKVFPINN